MRRKPNKADSEAARCRFLDRLCRDIERAIEGGLTAQAAVSKAAGRQRRKLFKHGRLSRSRLTVLFYAWRKSRSPEVFRRNYKPGKARVPLALIEEFLNRLEGGKVVPAAVVMRSLRSDWSLGRSIPGLGTWKDYVRAHHGLDCIRVSAPRFPVSSRTLFRVLEGNRPGEYRRRIQAALAAEAELVRYARLLDAARKRITNLRRHERLGVTVISAP